MTINHSELLSVVPGGADTQHHVDSANHRYLTSTEESKRVGTTLNGTLREHETKLNAAESSLVSHEANSIIHRPLNDNIISNTSLWSSHKINNLVESMVAASANPKKVVMTSSGTFNLAAHGISPGKIIYRITLIGGGGGGAVYALSGYSSLNGTQGGETSVSFCPAQKAYGGSAGTTYASPVYDGLYSQGCWGTSGAVGGGHFDPSWPPTFAKGDGSVDYKAFYSLADVFFVNSIGEKTAQTMLLSSAGGQSSSHRLGYSCSAPQWLSTGGGCYGPGTLVFQNPSWNYGRVLAGPSEGGRAGDAYYYQDGSIWGYPPAGRGGGGPGVGGQYVNVGKKGRVHWYAPRGGGGGQVKEFYFVKINSNFNVTIGAGGDSPAISSFSGSGGAVIIEWF